MDHKLNGLLKHCVLAFMLLQVQWRLVVSAAIPSSCAYLDSTKDLTKLLKHEAQKLLKEYENKHFPEGRNGLFPGYVDDFTISGANITEKLQNVYTKDVLFYLHILKVKEYQEIWPNLESVMEALSNLTARLSHHSDKIKTILKKMYTLLPTPPPLQLSHSHDYEKKVYGWDVIVTLRDWQTQVLQVIEEAKHVCDRWKSGLNTKRNSVETVATANIY